MDMVTRVAKAIWAESHGIDWGLADFPDRADCLAEARAAIEAMREMTPEMRAAMGQAIYNAGFNDWQHGWNAAIDAALKQHEEAGK